MSKSEKELYFTLKKIVEDLSELAQVKANYNVDVDVSIKDWDVVQSNVDIYL